MSAKFPTVTRSGDILPGLSGRRRQEQMDALYEASGGFQRALAWLEKSDENWEKFFLGPYAKGAQRAVTVEHAAGAGLEDLIEKMDRAGNAIDITPTRED